MPKKFTYTNLKTGRVIFESIEANYLSRDEVDQKVKEATGHDPRLLPHLIGCEIRIVDENEKLEPRNPKTSKHYKKKTTHKPRPQRTAKITIKGKTDDSKV